MRNVSETEHMSARECGMVTAEEPQEAAANVNEGKNVINGLMGNKNKRRRKEKGKITVIHMMLKAMLAAPHQTSTSVSKLPAL